MQKNLCRTTCHYEAKCRKALWLQAHKALWSNCKQTQSSKSWFFVCKKCELLLCSLHSLCSRYYGLYCIFFGQNPLGRIRNGGWSMQSCRDGGDGDGNFFPFPHPTPSLFLFHFLVSYAHPHPLPLSPGQYSKFSGKLMGMLGNRVTI